jgi:LemA protein
VNKFTGIIIAVAVVLLLILVPVGMYFSFYNSVTVLKNNVEAQLKQVDNQLQRRYDLIPNLVNTVKGYAKHEKEVFTNIADARSRLAQAGSLREKASANNQLDSALSRLLVVVERYPELKANEQFNRLSNNLEGTENRLAVERMRYNELVKQYNTKIQLFPGNIFAGMMGFTKLDYFDVPEQAKDNPEVKFD